MTLVTPGEEAVKVRNGLVASVGAPADFTWTPQETPATFRLNRAPPSPEFQRVAKELATSDAGPPLAGLDLALAIARHLMGAPKRVGGPIQSGLAVAYTGITQRGRGYCADFTQVFSGLAVAAGLPVRTWSISFESFGAGHAFNEIYDERLGKWVLVDSFHSLYFTDVDTLEPLSVIEVHDRLLAGNDQRPPVAIQHIVPDRFPFRSGQMALDYYRRGLSQLALAWGNNVFDYDQSASVRWSAKVSRHAERAVAIAIGQYPDLLIYPDRVSQRDVSSLARVRNRFMLAVGSFVLASVVFGWHLVATWRRPVSSRHGPNPAAQ
ncbi:MAG: transglutaminase-like domain-containing protein [Steroidobacteraceae bacterium]